MSELVRCVVARLCRTFGVHSKRLRARLPLRVLLAGGGSSCEVKQGCAGHTFDLSGTGLSLALPTTLIGNRHIFGEGGAVLRILLELPKGLVEMSASPVRYDLIEGPDGERTYFVGARIVAMSDGDRACYLEFLRSSARAAKMASRIRPPETASAVSQVG